VAKKKEKNFSFLWIALGILALFIGKNTPEPPQPEISPDSVKAGHEVTEVNSKGIMWLGIALILSAVVMHVSIGAFFFSLLRHDPEHILQHREPPEPRLQLNPQADLQIYLDRELQLMSTYGWIDQKAEVAHIPIEQAMDLLVDKSARTSEVHHE
jgi:hypothetical protein